MNPTSVLSRAERLIPGRTSARRHRPTRTATSAKQTTVPNQSTPDEVTDTKDVPAFVYCPIHETPHAHDDSCSVGFATSVPLQAQTRKSAVAECREENLHLLDEPHTCLTCGQHIISQRGQWLADDDTLVCRREGPTTRYHIPN